LRGVLTFSSHKSQDLFKKIPQTACENLLPHFFFLLSASYGMLDAITNRDPGIVLLSSLDGSKYLTRWRPIMDYPIVKE
jgi:hypothetical protein